MRYKIHTKYLNRFKQEEVQLKLLLRATVDQAGFLQQVIAFAMGNGPVLQKFIESQQLIDDEEEENPIGFN